MADQKENPYLKKENDRFVITEAGYKRLDEMVTDSKGQVYVFNGDLSPVVAAAAMARLSRRPGDMRLTVLDEFADPQGEAADALIERVVTQFGDDSVQQLITIQFVVEAASNLLTKLLEWGRFAAYLEQSTRYIYFDQKDEKGKYLYYTPRLSKELTKEYDQTMDQIFDLYSKMVREITDYLREKHPAPEDKKELIAWKNSTRATACDAIRPVLPASTKSTVGITASSQALESLIMHLLSEPLEEAHEVGELLLKEARKVIPAFLRRTDMPERGGATTAYRANNRAAMREVAQKYLPKKTTQTDEVTLVSYWPENELELVPEMLYESGEPLSLREIEAAVAGWEQKQRLEVFNAYMGNRLNRRHRPGRATEKAHFEWEVVGDYGSFRDLQRHRVVDAWEWQRLSPNLGYEVPELVKEAGFEKEFRKCFDLSKALYEKMVKAGYEVEGQYAVLMGYKMRYRFITNLRATFHLVELRTGPDGHPGYRRICNKMFDLLKEVYPESGKAMKFVNQRENPELIRQAAELATQYKLEKLDKGKKDS